MKRVVNNAKTKLKRQNSSILFTDLSGRSPFRLMGGRGFWWGMAAVAEFFLFPPLMLCLPERFQKSPGVFGALIGWLILFVGMMWYGVFLATKERAALLVATIEAPEEEHLFTYITAFNHGSEQVKDQAAQILSELLGRLPEDKLAYIPDETWSRLFPLPQDTPSGYSRDENIARKDQVNIAVFSAVVRMRRLKSLPYIEAWVQHLDVNRHSEIFVRTLHACHETLLNQQASLLHSGTLLRHSSAEAATSEVLLRPVQGSNFSEIETGEQLLRASLGENSAHSIPPQPNTPAGEN